MKNFVANFVVICALVLASGLSAQTIVIDSIPTYSISPTVTDAGAAFELHLLSYDFNCGDTYSNQTVSQIGDTILLGFVAHANPAAICPAIYMPYGPTFSISALPVGVYTVAATNRPACLVTPPNCLMVEPAPKFAGQLRVKGPTTRMWLSPNTLAKNDLAAISAQSRGFTCNDVFQNAKATLENKNLVVTFNFSQTKIACPVPDTALRSVLLQLPSTASLTRGKYPVFWRPDSTCVSGGLACTSDYKNQAFDTLLVNLPTSVHKAVKNKPGMISKPMVSGIRMDGRHVRESSRAIVVQSMVEK